MPGLNKFFTTVSIIDPKALVAKFAFLFVMGGLALSANIASATCLQDLSKALPFTLPKELKLKPNTFNYMLENPDDRALLESLNRIFAFSTDDNLEMISSWLRDTPEVGTSLASKASAYLDGANGEVLLNYFLLKQNISSVEADLTDDDLSLLAIFLERASFKPRVTLETVNDYEPIMKRMAISFDQPKYRTALSVMMKSPKSKNLFHKDWERRKAKYSLPDFQSTWNSAMLQLPTGKLDFEAKRMLKVYSIIFFSQHHHELTAPLDDESGFSFGQYADAMEKFLAINLQVPSHISDITSLMLYAFYDVPLPSSANELRQMLIDGAGRILLPAKGRFAKHATHLNKNTLATKTIVPIELKLVDFFLPSNEPQLRRRVNKPAQPADDTAPGLKISPELSLNSFSRSVDAPRPLAALRAGTVYQILHLRDSQQVIEDVVFSPEAVIWLQENELMARQMMDALNMGKARFRRQNGIKRLVKRSPFIKGSISEIKNPSSYRPLMARINNQWQVITIVEHDAVDLAIESLKPFEL